MLGPLTRVLERARMSAIPHIVPASFSRLTAFTAVSIALHAITLTVYSPAGGMSSPYAVPAALHATLMPFDREASARNVESSSGTPSTHDVERETSPSVDKPENTRSNGPDTPATASPRTDVAEGLSIPLPHKWFTARELDARAEPLTAASLVYPPELMRRGPAGKVRILLFIDERGIVRKSQIAAGASESAFDDAAIEAWKEVRFSPAEKNGVAVKSQKLLEIDFLPF